MTKLVDEQGLATIRDWAKSKFPQVEHSVGGGNLKIWAGTQSEYNSIGTKDDNTLYFIV